MNSISSFSVKMAALQLAVEARQHQDQDVMELAETMYEWMAQEIDFEKNNPDRVVSLTPVN